MGAAAATAAGAVAASTRRKLRASKAGLGIILAMLGGRRWWVVRQRSIAQVAARAEVAPGEKVVGIDLGTTNSAVAAMEVCGSRDVGSS